MILRLNTLIVCKPFFLKLVKFTILNKAALLMSIAQVMKTISSVTLFFNSPICRKFINTENFYYKEGKLMFSA